MRVVVDLQALGSRRGWLRQGRCRGAPGAGALRGRSRLGRAAPGGGRRGGRASVTRRRAPERPGSEPGPLPPPSAGPDEVRLVAAREAVLAARCPNEFGGAAPAVGVGRGRWGCGKSTLTPVPTGAVIVGAGLSDGSSSGDLAGSPEDLERCALVLEDHGDAGKTAAEARGVPVADLPRVLLDETVRAAPRLSLALVAPGPPTRRGSPTSPKRHRRTSVSSTTSRWSPTTHQSSVFCHTSLATSSCRRGGDSTGRSTTSETAFTTAPISPSKAACPGVPPCMQRRAVPGHLGLSSPGGTRGRHRTRRPRRRPQSPRPASSTCSASGSRPRPCPLRPREPP